MRVSLMAVTDKGANRKNADRMRKTMFHLPTEHTTISDLHVLYSVRPQFGARPTPSAGDANPALRPCHVTCRFRAASRVAHIHTTRLQRVIACDGAQHLPCWDLWWNGMWQHPLCSVISEVISLWFYRKVYLTS